MKISVSIMSHPSRKESATALYKKVTNKGFYETSLTFDDGGGEWATGVRALKSHTDSDYVILLQDDAIISNEFYDNALQAILSAPEQSLLSFYTGTVRPYESAVKRAVKKAGDIGASYLSFPTLNWGVGFAIPTNDIEPMLEFVKNMRQPFDERIGRYYLLNKKTVYYTYPSLVDHNYKLGSLIGNDKSVEPRKAHVYQPNKVYNWNKKVVAI